MVQEQDLPKYPVTLSRFVELRGFFESVARLARVASCNMLYMRSDTHAIAYFYAGKPRPWEEMDVLPEGERTLLVIEAENIENVCQSFVCSPEIHAKRFILHGARSSEGLAKRVEKMYAEKDAA